MKQGEVRQKEAAFRGEMPLTKLIEIRPGFELQSGSED